MKPIRSFCPIVRIAAGAFLLLMASRFAQPVFAAPDEPAAQSHDRRFSISAGIHSPLHAASGNQGTYSSTETDTTGGAFEIRYDLTASHSGTATVLSLGEAGSTGVHTYGHHITVSINDHNRFDASAEYLGIARRFKGSFGKPHAPAEEIWPYGGFGAAIYAIHGKSQSWDDSILYYPPGFSKLKQHSTLQISPGINVFLGLEHKSGVTVEAGFTGVFSYDYGACLNGFSLRLGYRL